MREDQRKQARVMVVDDEPQNVRYVVDVLTWAGYENVEGLTDPREAVARFGDFAPDLVVLDLLMPGMDGFEAMDAMRLQLSGEEYLPFLILTSDISSESRRRALSSGAKDFLTKPMSPTEVRLRVENLLETRLLYLQVASRPASSPVDDAPRGEGPSANEQAELLERWGASLEAALPDSEGRSKRVSWLAGRIAEELGQDEETVDRVRQAALLHLLGAKHVAAVSAGRPDSAAWASVQPDPDAGLRILEGTTIPALQTTQRMLASIDERWDGGGQPGGLRGDRIPLEARILAVARFFDERGEAAGVAEIESHAGSRFDPDVVAALLRVRAAS
ncbi:MAG: response regulator [Gemmatimonadetes bacterium]|nr:response regulator [Gemmatimonadota bacterium]